MAKANKGSKGVPRAGFSVTVNQLIAAEVALTKLNAAAGIPAIVMIEIAILINQVAPHLTAAVKVKTGLMEKNHAVRSMGPTGAILTVPPEHLDAFLKDVEPMGKHSVSIFAERIPASMIAQIPVGVLVGQDMLNLLPFIEIPKESK